MAGRKRQDIPDAGATMQIDAIADELEDYEAADELGAAPPPLPPQRRSKAAWIVGGLVVLLAAGLGIAAGVVLLGGEDPPPTPTASPAPAPANPPAPPAAAASPTPAPAEAAPAPPGEREVLQMDEIVFGQDEP
jgi:hypothetical protein